MYKCYMETMANQGVRFDWDLGNVPKCQKHGVSIAEIEALFVQGDPQIGDDVQHSLQEQRFTHLATHQTVDQF